MADSLASDGDTLSVRTDARNLAATPKAVETAEIRSAPTSVAT
jgi:hypothetical protein